MAEGGEVGSEGEAEVAVERKSSSYTSDESEVT